MEEQQRSLIELRSIVKTFNQGSPNELTVLHGIDLAVRRGEFLSVVGSSGSGKSTLMNIIGLLDRPTAGTYLLDGVNVLQSDDNALAQTRAQTIGFVFQNFNLVSRISALRNVEMPMMYAGIPPRVRTQRAKDLLGLVGMEDRMDHQPSELSGGQKQRVAIARALANDPEILLADEPTGALDSGTGRMVMDIFHSLHEEMGRSIVFITHNPELAQETDRIITLVDGRVEINSGGYL
ncbi:ABC transporter ATP-binding protein [Corynebacterium lowii]|uniref:Macrolide export ATP-binding/permease protein MacB n=1 Tax=Corynebacterium lowii TaxID=1544413 RepID=A0A0Q0YX84_9CORY|nr:ABC transporter ATP-binding protein [Corynebacterium lowii]KQB86984.1 Macrolide export ATP-binding/permease protein MacB [Corynebacterium lowii]MDP9852435.1 putative ABC transport system ATP-binding protein [Corynebacterium lowii]